MGEFAFACNSKPGSQDGAPFNKEIMQPLFELDDAPEKAVVRRLHFEAYTMAAAGLQRCSTQQDDDKPRRLPLVGRNA